MLDKKKIQNKVYKYLKKFYPDKITLAFALSAFAHTHGNDKAENLYYFIRCWEKMAAQEKAYTNMILQTLLHDMGIADESSASPRSGTYTKKYVYDFLAKMADIEKEKTMVTTCPEGDLPLIVTSLKYEANRKILEQRLKGENYATKTK